MRGGRTLKAARGRRGESYVILSVSLWMLLRCDVPSRITRGRVSLFAQEEDATLSNRAYSLMDGQSLRTDRSDH